MLVNPPVDVNGSNTTSTNFSVDTNTLFTTFRAQLRVLLGLAPPERVFNVPSKPGTGVQMWQVHRLARVRTLQRLSQASNALVGLLAAVNEIPDLVVGEDIQRGVQETVAAAIKTKEALGNHSLILACRGAAYTAQLAEDASQHPSLLEMLYFPEEDKYALCVEYETNPLAAGLTLHVKVRAFFSSCDAWHCTQPQDLLRAAAERNLRHKWKHHDLDFRP